MSTNYIPGTGIQTKNLCPPRAGKNDPGNFRLRYGRVTRGVSCIQRPPPLEEVMVKLKLKDELAM